MNITRAKVTFHNPVTVDYVYLKNHVQNHLVNYRKFSTIRHSKRGTVIEGTAFKLVYHSYGGGMVTFSIFNVWLNTVDVFEYRIR